MDAKRLAHAAEAVALAAVVGAPLALGAVHAPVALAVAALGCLSFLLLALSLRGHRLHVGWLAPLLLVVNAVALLQLLPLPPGLVALLSPEAAALYAAAGVGGWHPLTLDAAATAQELAKGVGWLCVFAVLQHRAGASRSARRRVLVAVAAAGAAVAFVGLGHWVAGENRTLFGLYEYGGAKPFLSTFGNTNNLSGFLNVGALLALGLAAQADRRRPRLLWSVAFLACVGSSILTASRGGAMALLAGLLLLPILGVGSRRRKETGEAEGWKGWATVGGAVAVASGIAWWLYDAFPRLMREIATVFDFDPAAEEGKFQAYEIALDAARVHPWLGIGRGAFESAQAVYHARPWTVAFTHAENEPLQAVAELGWPVGVLLILGICAAWLALVRRGRLSWVEAGAAAAAFALLLQNLVDFSLQFAPGLALLALYAHHARRELRVRAAPVAGLAAAAVLVVGAGTWKALPDYDVDVVRLTSRGADSTVSFEQLEAEARAAWQKRPAWFLPAEVAATRALAEPGGARRALPWINELLRLHPQSGRGHLLAAEVFAQLGRRDQALGEFRRAAQLRTPSVERVLAHWPDDHEAVRAAVPREADAALPAVGPVEKAGHRALAIELLERLAEADDDERVVRRRYWLHSTDGDHERALALAGRLRALEPDKAAPVALEARSLRALKRPDEARARYEEALALEPKSTDALFGLSELAIDEKRTADALALLDRIPVAAGASVQNNRLWHRARAYRADKNLLKARDELRLLVGRAPSGVWYRVTLVDVLLDLGQLDEAEKVLEPVIGERAAANVEKKLARLREAERQRQQELYEQRLLRGTVK